MIIIRGSLLLLLSLLIVISFQITQITFTSSEKDFIFLARILKEQTKDIENYSERLRIMTDWLHKNVRPGKYPPNYNPKGAANVIRAGLGNCGFQACNIVCFAELLGLKDHQLIHSRKEWGAPGIHTFAEIWIKDRWIIYDPDKWQYIENNEGKLVGIIDIMTDTSSIRNKKAACWIYSTIKNGGNRVTPSWQITPLPFGESSYFHFEKYGMPFLYLKKLMRKPIQIFIEILLLFGIIQLFLFYKDKNDQGIQIDRR